MMQIRKLVGQDASAFRALRLEGLRMHPQAFGASLAAEEAQALCFFEDRIVQNCVLGAFLDDALVGTAALRFSAAEKTAHIAVVWGVYVSAEARGTGLARQLMTKLLAYASAHRSVRLSVTVGNDAAYRLYESLGFVAWATEREALNVNGIFYDEILMRRDRQP